MLIKKAVIPAAGLGTRFLPITKAMAKEMLPLVDKPIIQYAVEEAITADIRDIVVITGKGKRSIEDHFDYSFELEHYLKSRGKHEHLNTIKEIADLANFVYIRQKQALGLGHAIAQAKDVVGEEPFAVFLPDDVIDCNGEEPCICQLKSVYEKFGSSVLALMEVPKEDYSRYGMVAAEKVGDNIYKITDLVEKPEKVSNSPSNLAVIGRYILTPKIFEILENTPAGAGGEVQLTDALRELLKHEPIYGVVFKGTRLDAGEKLGYLQATISLALKREDLAPELKKFLKGLKL